MIEHQPYTEIWKYPDRYHVACALPEAFCQDDTALWVLIDMTDSAHIGTVINKSSIVFSFWEMDADALSEILDRWHAESGIELQAIGASVSRGGDVIVHDEPPF